MKKILEKINKFVSKLYGLNEDTSVTIFSITKLDDGKYFIVYKEHLSKYIYKETHDSLEDFLRINKASPKVLEGIKIA